MVYKKYIKKNGKTYGPYYYKNIRDKDGNVKNIFLGKEKPKLVKQPKVKPAQIIILTIILSILIITSLHYTLEKKKGFELTDMLEIFMARPDFRQFLSPPRAGESPFWTQDPLPQVNCNEDEQCTFDLSLYTDDPDTPHENLKYSTDAYDPGNDFFVFQMDSNTGIVDFTATHNGETGTFTNIAMIVSDQEENVDAAFQTYIISPVNDHPIMDYIGNFEQRSEVPFYIDFNATDEEDGPDINNKLTYSRVFLGDSLSGFDFSDPNQGIISFTPQIVEIPTSYQIEIIVTDQGGATDNEIITFTVYPNSAPYFDPLLENQTAYEDTEFIYDIDAYDVDEDQITYSDNSTLFNIDPDTGLIQFTPTIENTGERTINITITDIYLAENSSEFILTIHEIDDSPILDQIGDLVAPEDFEFSYDVNATDEEDAPNGEDGLLKYYVNYTDLTPFDLFTINEITGEFNFTPTNDQVGIHNLNFSVFDTYGNYDSEIVELNISNTNDPPFIIDYFPEDNKTIYENETLYFNNSADDDDLLVTVYEALFYRWYKNSIENNTYSQEFNYSSSFDDQGNVNITGKVFDLASEQDKISWNITVLNVNRPPYLSQIIPNETSAMNFENPWIYLNQYLVDPDNENIPTEDDNNITYNFTFLSDNHDNETNSTHLNISINQNTSLIKIQPLPDWTGSELVYFTANDSEFKTESNEVNITIAISQEPQPEPQPQPKDNPTSSSTRTKIASLDITVSSLLTAESNESITTPITLKNSGEVNLNYINLEASEDSGDLELDFEDGNFNSLNVGQSVTTDLIINSLDLNEESYIISITVEVSNPSLSESTIIYLASIPTNLTKVEVEIKFAKDLFEKNPGCLELKELITQAESEYSQGNDALAIALIEGAVQSCSEIIKESGVRIPSVSEKTLKIFLPVSLSIISLLIAIIVVLYYLYKRK